MRRFWLRPILILFLAGLLHQPAIGQELRVALVPQETADKAASGGLARFNEALAREICRRMTARCTTVDVAFADILPGIEGGQYDLGFGNFLRTPEREQRVAFSDPIWRSSSRLLARQATISRLTRRAGAEPNLDQLRDQRIVVIQDSQQQFYVQPLAGERRLTLLKVSNVSDAIAALRDGKADFGLLPILNAYTVLAREAPGSFAFVGPPLTAHDLGGTVHIALPLGNAPLRQAVNRAIAAIRADGSYHRLSRQYFPFSLD